jgi:hypothetical protein
MKAESVHLNNEMAVEMYRAIPRSSLWVCRMAATGRFSLTLPASLLKQRLLSSKEKQAERVDRQRRFNASSSSSVRGHSAPSSRDRLRSARTFPPVWQRAQ